jgi:hypothetical protein
MITFGLIHGSLYDFQGGNQSIQKRSFLSKIIQAPTITIIRHSKKLKKSLKSTYYI